MSEINIEHLLERAATLEKENDYDEALRLYNRILEVAPDNELANDRRRAIRDAKLLIVAKSKIKAAGPYFYYVELDGKRIGTYPDGNPLEINVPLGKHRITIMRGQLGRADLHPVEIAFYDFIMSHKEQFLYLHRTENAFIHFSELEHEEGSKEEFNAGCYVATVVYGSYDCPQVWTLRRFRDNTLAATWYGRTFIHTYYAISPTLVKWFGKTAWFKNLWKPTLDRMVKRLNASGVKDTPYNDKVW